MRREGSAERNPNIDVSSAWRSLVTFVSQAKTLRSSSDLGKWHVREPCHEVGRADAGLVALAPAALSSRSPFAAPRSGRQTLGKSSLKRFAARRLASMQNDLRAGLAEAIVEVGAAESDLAELLRTMNSAPRAEKTTISAAVQDALARLTHARKSLIALQELIPVA